jgi:hypothetical protein
MTFIAKCIQVISTYTINALVFLFTMKAWGNTWKAGDIVLIVIKLWALIYTQNVGGVEFESSVCGLACCTNCRSRRTFLTKWCTH